MWNSQNVQLKHEKSNSMSIVLQPDPNCIDKKQQLYPDFLTKYTTQTCNSTLGNKQIKKKKKKTNLVYWNELDKSLVLQDFVKKKKYRIKIFGGQIYLFFADGESETASHTEVWQKHTHCTSVFSWLVHYTLESDKHLQLYYKQTLKGSTQQAHRFVTNKHRGLHPSL